MPYAEPPDRGLEISALPPDFWTVDLRLGMHSSWTARVTDPDWRLQQVSRAFPTRRVVDTACAAAGVSPEGRLADAHQRLSDLGEGVLPWLLVARFAAHKHPRAVEDVARLTLGDPAVDDLRGGRELDRVAALVAVALRRPDALPWVRGMHHWHTRGMARLALGSRSATPVGALRDTLSKARVEQAIANVPQSGGAPLPQFEMVVPLADGSDLLVLRRNLRRNHHWDDHGVRIHHGHDEELITLHFAKNGRQVGVCATTAELPRQLAEAVGSAWFGDAVRYVDVVDVAPPASVGRMLTALATGVVPDLVLVELGARNTPFATSPEIVLRATHGDIRPALNDFAAMGRPLAMRVEDVLFLRVRFRGRAVLIDFPKQGDDIVVRFADGRLDREEADALRVLIEHHFSVRATSTDAKVA